MVDPTLRQNIQNLLSNLQGSRASLVQLSGVDIGKTHELMQEVTVIGRSPECSIMLDDDGVSREHARLQRTERGILLQDLNSTNGTLVNGQRVSQHLMEDGDRLQIGNTVVFKFNYQDEMESAFNEELYNSANRDYLTQVYNKKYLMDRLRMEFSFAKRHNTKLGVILFDVDHFKAVNDLHGHLAGDEILKQLCERMTQAKREEDVLARFGGEEFLLLLREADATTAQQMAEKMRKLVEEAKFRIDDKNNAIAVTISLGVAALDHPDPNHQVANTMDELILQADNQLYRAKREGRNRCCF